MKTALDIQEFPLLLTTEQAARYLAGRSVDSPRVNTGRFLRFAERYGLQPKGFTEATRRVGGESVSYVRRLWSRRQIDRILG